MPCPVNLLMKVIKDQIFDGINFVIYVSVTLIGHEKSTLYYVCVHAQSTCSLFNTTNSMNTANSLWMHYSQMAKSSTVS